MKKTGVGVSACIYTLTAPGASNPGSAIVQIKEDGSIVIQTGAEEIGQGSDTILCQIAAEALGTTMDKVTILSADTKATPYDLGSIGSRITFVVGNAVFRAVNDAKAVLAETVAKRLSVPTDRLKFENEKIIYTYDEERFMTLSDAAMATQFEERKLALGKGVYFPHNIPLNAEVRGEPCDTYSFLVVGAKVEVDDETGEVTVLDMKLCVDGGTVINPLLFRGQAVGGATQNIGWTLTENLIPYFPSADENYEDFNIDYRSRNFAEYDIPTAMDVGTFDVSSTDTFEPTHPYGARGIGEIVANGGAPAIANAIYDAVGVRIRELPCTKEKILKAIVEKKA